MPDPDAPMDDPPPTDLAACRAERARRNGARSRGPVSERGKDRSSRNALRHGLTAQVHLVLDRDDEAEFMALAAGLEGELAPRGTLEAFLVARLTAAMWHTGRAERMEARAFAAADPDPDRLRLALRYRGSVQRELFRCLRALQELRRRPLALGNRDHDDTAEPERHAAEPSPDAIDPIRLAIAAWGGERAGPIPPGFLELRPVPQVWPIAWRFVQDRAFPGDVPLLVYADGTVRSPEGRLLEDVWSPEAPPSPPEPAVPPPIPAPTMTPVPAAEPSSALACLDDEEVDDPLLTPQRRNEPTQPFVSTGISDRPLLSDTGPPIPQIGLGRMAPELDQMPAGDDMQPAPEAPSALGGNMLPPQDRPETSRLQTAARNPVHSPRLGAWEQMWGITLPEPEPIACEDDTSEPDPTDTDEQNCTIELTPCTSEPEPAAACVGSCRDSAGSGLERFRTERKPSPSSRPRADRPQECQSALSQAEHTLGKSGVATSPHRDDPSARPETSDGSDGRPGQLRRRNPRLARRRYASHPEDDP